MTFSDVLNKYMSEYSLTVSSLSDKSGLSKSSISRFRNGLREPQRGSEAIAMLARAICQTEKCILSYEEVLKSLENALKKPDYDFESITKKLNLLISTLGINAHDLSRYLKYDASYLSRIRSGQRKPANPTEFCNGVAEFVSKHFDSAELIGLVGSDIREGDNILDSRNAIFKWLTDKTSARDNTIEQFLSTLDNFDLASFIISNTGAPSLDLDKTGIEENTSVDIHSNNDIKNCQLDFLRYTITNSTQGDVYFYSDMPIEKTAGDPVFISKWISGLSSLLKKGIRINIIHNVERSLYEMMLGLKGWIPLYMTGLVSPYYLKDMHDPAFHHFIAVSGDIALGGEAIKESSDNAHFHLTTKNDELAYYKKRAEALFKRAEPLMEIYCSSNSDDFIAGMKKCLDCKTSRLHSILTSPPVYTIPYKLLSEILQDNGVDDEMQRMIFDYAKAYKELTELQLKNDCTINDELSVISEEEYKEHPVSLPLADLFSCKEIYYTYEQYCRHIEASKKYAEDNKAYCFISSEKKVFYNIQIRIVEEQYAIVSKNKSPAIHFVIKHPKLRYAIEHINLG